MHAMTSKKRKRERQDYETLSKKTKHHHDEFLKREKARLEHEQEKQSLQLIAELQKKEEEEQKNKKKQESNHLMLCIELEHGDARKGIENEFNRRKTVTDADRERLKQDLEYVDSRYEDMRKQLLQEKPSESPIKESEKESEKSEKKEPAKKIDNSVDTEKRLLYLESCGKRKLCDVPYKNIGAYRYARLHLKNHSLTSEQSERFETALKMCTKNGWK